jgi:hypothetical protein
MNDKVSDTPIDRWPQYAALLLWRCRGPIAGVVSVAGLFLYVLLVGIPSMFQPAWYTDYPNGVRCYASGGCTSSEIPPHEENGLVCETRNGYERCYANAIPPPKPSPSPKHDRSNGGLDKDAPVYPIYYSSPSDPKIAPYNSPEEYAH